MSGIVDREVGQTEPPTMTCIKRQDLGQNKCSEVERICASFSVGRGCCNSNTQVLVPLEGYHKECLPGIGW